MAKQLLLKVVTPERLILEELVDQVSLPTTEGEITVLPDHIPLVSGLASGDVVGVSGGEHIPFAVVGGFVEVKQNDDKRTEVAVLADFAEPIAELTDQKIEEAKAESEKLKERMKNKDVVTFEHFATQLERSLTRVKIADKWKRRKYRK
jgi:F-type H+-transporting ATPase subunit epsilon